MVGKSFDILTLADGFVLVRACCTYSTHILFFSQLPGLTEHRPAQYRMDKINLILICECCEGLHKFNMNALPYVENWEAGRMFTV